MRTSLATPRRRTPKPRPIDSAGLAGLRYVSDRAPGLSRSKSGSGFRYKDASGRPIKDDRTLARIRSLAIPPAWFDVWICADGRGHIQATGRDERGRKQYRYHPLWRRTRDDSKYARMVPFGKALPAIRARVEADLTRPGLPREKVLALVVRLLESTMIRVGNDEYARSNHSYGLTTMRDSHAKLERGRVRFAFRGKSGVRHEIEVDDPRLAKLVRACRDLPGQELFQYRDDTGRVRDIGSADVNAYLREVSGHDFTAKDFRTWAGTILAALALREFEAFDSEAQAKKNIVRAIEAVAEKLGNTPTVCRKCYVHPEVLGSYLDGTMLPILRRRAEEAMAEVGSLKPEEAAVLALIRRRLAEAAKA